MARIVRSLRALATSLGIVVVLASCTAASAATGQTSLRIVFRSSPHAAPRVATLHCAPPGGTVERPAAACRRLATLGRAAFAATPPGSACTQIYGGPQQAVVTGTVDGARVWARLTRVDGCALARWSRVAFLIPGR